MRRLPITAALMVTAAGLLLAAAPASGQGAPAPAEGAPASDVVDVVKVDGLLDPVIGDFIVRSINEANAVGSIAIVLQMDSSGSVLGEDELADVVGAMADSAVPVWVWIGPSGSSATGGAALLAGYAAEVGMAPGTSWGLDGATVPTTLLDGALRSVPDAVVDNGVATTDWGATMAPTIGDLIVDIPGMRTQEVTVDGETRREPLTPVRFSQLPLLENLLHAVASPAVAYLLLTVGMALLLFELFTAGVGVAGGVAAGSLILGAYGLAWLPVRWWALALVVLSMLAFAIDVQTGVPRVWTGIGMVLYVVGSLWLYDGVSMSWITLGVAFIGVLLTFTTGIPSMVRTRFATPTIGREWMIGEMGRAVSAVAPDGVVQVRGALWRATTNRATPIDELDQVRVIGIDGLVLEVEPEEGGARDYRERARGRATAAGAPGEGAVVDEAPSDDDSASAD